MKFSDLVAGTVGRFTGPGRAARQTHAPRANPSDEEIAARYPNQDLKAYLTRRKAVLARHEEAVKHDAIAAIWHTSSTDEDHGHAPYENKIYAIRGGWAASKGLISAGDGFTDEIDEPCSSPSCTCRYQFIFNIGDLPETMVTKLGRSEVKQIKQHFADIGVNLETIRPALGLVPRSSD